MQAGGRPAPCRTPSSIGLRPFPESPRRNFAAEARSAWNGETDFVFQVVIPAQGLLSPRTRRSDDSFLMDAGPLPRRSEEQAGMCPAGFRNSTVKLFNVCLNSGDKHRSLSSLTTLGRCRRFPR